jgi:p-aminobenzoyl-glutamate transporter AbgT
MNKKALKTAGIYTVIALAIFEAMACLVVLFDPEGGMLRINLGNPIHHAIMVIIAIAFGIYTYIKESRKGNE